MASLETEQFVGLKRRRASVVLPGESGVTSSSLRSYGDPYDETSETRFYG